MIQGANRVIVIGGGVIGMACAHYLRQSGHAVVVLDQGKIGGACSHANCGFVCPSHVLPLAGPGVIGKTLKTLVEKNSPLSIKPRLDPALWNWLYQFARRCNTADMMESARAIQAMLNASRSLYDDLFREESLDAEWETRGLLFVFLTQKAMDHYAETDRLLRDSFHMGATRYDGQALNDLEPALKPGLAGGWHYQSDAHLRPDKLLSSWRSVLEARGVEFLEGCTFRGFDRDGRVVRAVETSQGRFSANTFLVTTGAWTPLLHAQLGCRIPIQPGKGYSLTMARPKVCPSIPLIFEEHRVAVTPLKSGYRIGSTMEFAGYDETMNPARLELLRQGASHYLRQPTAEPLMEQWWGWRPMIYDGKPAIGPSPSIDNVLIAAGHGMLGLSMAPATGRLVAELIDGRTPHIDPTPYALTRF